MSDTNKLLLSIVTRLTTNLDKIDRVDEVLEMLEQCFLNLFKSTELQRAEATSTLKGNAKAVPLLTSASPIASTEEYKLEITTAVLNFHLHARERHSNFLRNKLYHPHAALFIHELLKSLSGNSQLWFRSLQIRALETCSAIVQSIGTNNVRRCLPGIISATTKYIHRAHHGKDAIRVRLSAIELLHATLLIALTHTTQEQKDNVDTMEETSSSTFMEKVSCKREKEEQLSLQKTECVQSLCKINQDNDGVKHDNNNNNWSSNKNINIIEQKGENDHEANMEKTWLINTIPHLHSTLQSVLLASELCNSVQYDVRTLVALRELVIMFLSSSLMYEQLHTPLAAMLFASYHILTSLVQLTSLLHLSSSGTEHSERKFSVLPIELSCCKDAQNALRRFLMEMNGLEFLHLATSILHHTHLYSLMLTRGSAFDELHECNAADVHETQEDENKRMYCKMADDIDSAVNTFLFTLLIKKCISVVKKTFTNDEYYSNVNYQFKLSESLHCCVVNHFLISLAHALYVMSTYEPASQETSQTTDISNKDITDNNVEISTVSPEGTDGNEITNGEVLTNILFAECEAILQDWYQYDVHAAVVYILARAIIWQFSWSIHVECLKWEKMIAHHYDMSKRRCDSNYSVDENTSLRFLLPSWFVNDGVFDELWSVIGMPHLWNILVDEELCSFEQLKHRQLMASTILRCLCLIIEHVFGTADVCIISNNDSHNNNDVDKDISIKEKSEGNNYENSIKYDNCTIHSTIMNIDNAVINTYRNAFERFVTRTLYLVLEKAASANHVHETAMYTVHTYANAEAACESMENVNTYSSSFEHTTIKGSKYITGCIAQETRVESANMLAKDKNIDKSSIFNNYVNINLHFILKYGHLIIDDAIRSAKVDELQNSAASILRGVVAFFMESIEKRKINSNSEKESKEKNLSNKENICNKNINNVIEFEDFDTNTNPELSTNASPQEIRSANNDNNGNAPPSRLVEVVQSLLSVASIERKLSRIERLDDHTISTMATFLSASVKVGLECCQSIWENENYAMSQRTWQTHNKGNNSSNRDKYCTSEMEFDQLNEEVVRSRRAALVLLCDSAHLAALLNFSTPLRPFCTLGTVQNESNSIVNGDTTSSSTNIDACEMTNSSHDGNDNEEDEERQTTSSNVQVQGLQHELLTAIDKLLSWFSTLDRLTSYAIRAIIEILTVFLTTTKAITEIDTAYKEECTSSNSSSTTKKDKFRNNSVDDSNNIKRVKSDNVQEESVAVNTNKMEQEHHQHFNTEEIDSKKNMTSTTTDKKLNEKEKAQEKQHKFTIEQESIINTSSTLQSIVVLPQSMLKVVYKVYLSFTSMLKEPIAALVTNTQKFKSKWTAHEIRVLLAIPIRASLFSVLDGLHALLLLAPDFLIHRMVHEVMPLCLVWYEKVKRTRILTDTDNRLKHNIEEFAYVIHARCYKKLQNELEQICAPYFTFAKTTACHDRWLTQVQA